MTGRYAAIHAPRCLPFQFFFWKRPVYLIEVANPLGHWPSFGEFASIFFETGWFTHFDNLRSVLA
jgi:hypothetical protein